MGWVGERRLRGGALARRAQQRAQAGRGAARHEQPRRRSNGRRLAAGRDGASPSARSLSRWWRSAPSLSLYSLSGRAMEEKVPMTVVVPDLSPRPAPLGPSPAPAPEPEPGSDGGDEDGTPRLPSERRSPRGAPSSGGRRPGRRAPTSSAAAPPCRSPPASPTPPPSCPCPPGQQRRVADCSPFPCSLLHRVHRSCYALFSSRIVISETFTTSGYFSFYLSLIFSHIFASFDFPLFSIYGLPSLSLSCCALL